MMAGTAPYGVTVLGACSHRWPGTVLVELGDTGPGRFVLEQDDKTCPECGANATTVMFEFEGFDFECEFEGDPDGD